jgi:hypothetical protein
MQQTTTPTSEEALLPAKPIKNEEGGCKEQCFDKEHRFYSLTHTLQTKVNVARSLVKKFCVKKYLELRLFAIALFLSSFYEQCCNSYGANCSCKR